MLYSEILTVLIAITGVVLAIPAGVKRDDNYVSVNSAFGPPDDFDLCPGSTTYVSAGVGIDWPSGLITAFISDKSQNTPDDELGGISICGRDGFMNWDGSPNWFHCRNGNGAWIKNDSGLGGNIRDGHPPILGYYRVSDNTNYRLIMQPTTEWGQQGTHWLYDANGAIVEMSAYGQWCI